MPGQEELGVTQALPAGRRSWRRRPRLLLASAIAVAAAAAAGATVATGGGVATGSTGSAGPGCQGPQLTGTASPALVLHPPQTLTVTETLTDNCAGLRPSHIALYLTGPQGWTVSPAGARAVADLKPGASDTLTWQVQVPAGGTGSGLAAQAIYDVGAHSTDSTRASITAAVAYSSMAAAFDDTGVTNDSDTGPATSTAAATACRHRPWPRPVSPPAPPSRPAGSRSPGRPRRRASRTTSPPAARPS
jgi:NPCBM-associated, NEW3 domain of alpha-galactosidase